MEKSMCNLEFCHERNREIMHSRKSLWNSRGTIFFFLAAWASLVAACGGLVALKPVGSSSPTRDQT